MVSPEQRKDECMPRLIHSERDKKNQRNSSPHLSGRSPDIR